MYTTLFHGGTPWVHRILISLEQLSSRHADRIIVTNESHQRMIVRRSAVPIERITVVRNGPNAQVLKWQEPTPELRKAGKVTLCYVGVMGQHDGVDYLLHALHHLVYNLQRTEVFCLLVGAGNAWLEMKELSVKLRLEEYLCFVGWVYPKEVSRYLSAADICLAPEPSNAYNDRCTVIKIAEYMALGKPVVAFDLPEHRVTAQGAALYAEPNRIEVFAEQIATLMDDPALRQRMGELGRRRVEEELAWPHQAIRLLHVYHSLTEAVPRLA
jgi:glycosyltransferase involved in cell wall biosynthesis